MTRWPACRRSRIESILNDVPPENDGTLKRE